MKNTKLSQTDNCKYKRKKNGVITMIYSKQKKSSIARGYDTPNYTKEQFSEWVLNQPIFHKLYDIWVDSGYIKDLKPSVDRIDDYKSYTFDNIQIMTWRDNREKVKRDMICGINNKNSKAVLQYDLNGNFIKEYYSIKQARRESGAYCENISKVCLGKLNKTGGFVWKYKEPLKKY